MGARNSALVSLTLDTGLRFSEVAYLEEYDVHLEDRYVKVLGKGGKDPDLVFRGVLPVGLGPDLPDESLGLLGRDLCYLGLTGVVLGHFRLFSRYGKSIPCTGSPNTPPPSCFYPFKGVPLSLNAYTPDTVLLLPSGISVCGIETWVRKLDEVA